MVEFTALWLPVVVSTVAVFFLSFVMWMVLPHHRSDYRQLHDEDRVMNTLRELGAHGPGQFMFPHCSDPAQMKDPEWMKRYDNGPKGMLVLKAPGPVSMGGAMVVSTIYNLVVIAIVAGLASMVMPRVVDGWLVFRFVGVATFLGFAGALGWGAIWMGKSWSSTFKEVFDGAVYGVATGAIFMALWPGVA